MVCDLPTKTERDVLLSILLSSSHPPILPWCSCDIILKIVDAINNLYLHKLGQRLHKIPQYPTVVNGTLVGYFLLGGVLGKVIFYLIPGLR